MVLLRLNHALDQDKGKVFHYLVRNRLLPLLDSLAYVKLESLSTVQLALPSFA